MTCTESTQSTGAGQTFHGSGLLDDLNDQCYYGAPTCNSGTATDGPNEACPDHNESSNTCYWSEKCTAGVGCEYDQSESMANYCSDSGGNRADSGDYLWENASCSDTGPGFDSRDCNALDAPGSETDSGIDYDTQGTCTSAVDGFCDSSGTAQCDTTGGNSDTDFCNGDSIYEFYLNSNSCSLSIYDCNNDDVVATENDSGRYDYDDYGKCFGGNDYSCGSGECQNQSYPPLFDFCSGDVVYESWKSSTFQCSRERGKDCNTDDVAANDPDGNDPDTANTCQGGVDGYCGTGACRQTNFGNIQDSCDGSGDLIEATANGLQCQTEPAHDCGDVGCLSNSTGPDRCYQCDSESATCNEIDYDRTEIEFCTNWNNFTMNINYRDDACNSKCQELDVEGSVCDGDIFTSCYAGTVANYSSGVHSYEKDSISNAGECFDDTQADIYGDRVTTACDCTASGVSYTRERRE